MLLYDVQPEGALIPCLKGTLGAIDRLPLSAEERLERRLDLGGNSHMTSANYV